MDVWEDVKKQLPGSRTVSFISFHLREIIDSFELLREKKKNKNPNQQKKKIKKPFLIKI